MTRWRQIPVYTAFLFLLTVNGATAQPQRVLLLHSFGPDFAPWNEIAKNIRAELRRLSPRPVDIHEVSLASGRFPEEAGEGPLADYLRTLFVDRKLDLVIAIAGPAANFVQRYRSQLFPSVPVVLTGIDQRHVVPAALTANDVVVATTLDLAAIIDNILRVRPETTNVAVVIGRSALEKFWLAQLQDAFQVFAGRVTFSYFDQLPFDDMLLRAAVLPPGSAIFFTILAVDAAGVPHEELAALSRLHAAANSPIFSYVDTFLGHGIVGGPLLPAEEVSRTAAGVSIHILGGTPPGEIKLTPIALGTPKFDWRELQRWNIRPANLLSGSEIRFKPATMWEQYRWQVITILATLLFQAAVITWLLLERHRRKHAEIQSRQRLLETMHLNRSATAGALSASVAHELNQPLGAILSNTEAAEQLIKSGSKDLELLSEILVDIRRDDQRAGEIIRRLRSLLRKDELSLQEFALDEEIRDSMRMLEGEARRRGVTLKAALTAPSARVQADKVHLQQVMLNVAINGMDAMLGCAPAKRQLIFQSALNGSTVEVAIADSGTGIPEAKLRGVFDTFYTTKPQGTGLGLSIARTIVETYGGTIWAENRPVGGAIFRFTLPIAAAQSA